MTLAAHQTSIKNEIYYPDTDGEPMAESDFQRKPLMYAVEALDLYFQARADVYVSGNLLIYYEQDNPKASVAPDVFVVFGVAKGDRYTYKTWEEGKGPDVVIEITSHTTRVRDEVEKPVLYRHLGVKEYFQYDPTGDYLQPALRGQWLDEDGEYHEIPASQLADGVLKLESHLLGLELRLEEGRLRLYDPAKAEYLLTHAEERMYRLSEEKARYQAETRVKSLEAELERLRARLDQESEE